MNVDRISTGEMVLSPLIQGRGTSFSTTPNSVKFQLDKARQVKTRWFGRGITNDQAIKRYFGPFLSPGILGLSCVDVK